MKNLIVFTATYLLLFSACKKDSSKKNEKNIFAIDSVEYKVTQTGKESQGGETASYYFYDKKPFSTSQWQWVNVWFYKKPTVSGVYKLNSGYRVDYPDKIMLTVFSNSTGKDEFYRGLNAVPEIDVNVTVTKGKISLTIPEVYLRNVDGMIRFSGTLKEM